VPVYPHGARTFVIIVTMGRIRARAQNVAKNVRRIGYVAFESKALRIKAIWRGRFLPLRLSLRRRSAADFGLAAHAVAV
jgi:hypothetical protein